jgi:hypothetical protein
MCAAYCASNGGANDNDDSDNDRRDPPSRAVPRHLRDDVLPTTILRLPFLASEGHSLGAVAIRSSMLVWRWALRRGGRATIAAFV